MLMLMLTTFEEDRLVWDAVRAGASGFLLKTMRLHELAEAVRRAARGDALLAPSITLRLVEQYAAGPAPDARSTCPASRQGGGGAGAGRERQVQHRDRGGPVPGRGDRQDARRQPALKTAACDSRR